MVRSLPVRFESLSPPLPPPFLDGGPFPHTAETGPGEFGSGGWWFGSDGSDDMVIDGGGLSQPILATCASSLYRRYVGDVVGMLHMLYVHT